jgi:hypothetical protein
MGRKTNNHEIYNRGSEFEIEALFIKNWCELKRLLYKHMWVKAAKAKMGDK